MNSSRHLEVSDAIALLREARGLFSADIEDSLSLAAAAKRLDLSPDWIRQHLVEFPNAWRLPAGEIKRSAGGRNVGELRIPVKDLVAFQERQRLTRP